MEGLTQTSSPPRPRAQTSVDPYVPRRCSCAIIKIEVIYSCNTNPTLITSNFGPTSNGSKAMRKLSTLLPTMRWVPHDIERPAPSKKEKERPKRPILGRKGDPNHGTLKHRKSVISFSSEFDGESDASAHMQIQSAFFAQLPIEIRKIIYEYVVGEEIVHLVFAKKKFGHFLCPSQNQGVECTCKVLVGGTQCKQLNGSCVKMLTTCRRMQVTLISTTRPISNHKKGTLKRQHICMLRIRSLCCTSRTFFTYLRTFRNKG